MQTFRKVGPVGQFKERRGRVVTVDGVRIAVFREGGRFHAFDDQCPHMGASLAGGRLIDGKVRCSWHGWEFDLASGRTDAREWACLSICETRVDGGELWVRLREPEPPTEDRSTDAEWFVWDPEKNRVAED